MSTKVTEEEQRPAGDRQKYLLINQKFNLLNHWKCDDTTVASSIPHENIETIEGQLQINLSRLPARNH